MSDLDLLIGKWVVKVQPHGQPEPWTWEYDFQPGGKLTWQDLKGPQNGRGTWNANSTLVNIWWENSATRESWLRPLTPTPPPSKTWYEASYYRGQYQVEKPICPGFKTDGGPLKLSTPEEIYQDGLQCWAAGSAIWLHATNKGTATVADLIKKYKERGKIDSQSALPEENVFEVFGDIGIDLHKMRAVDFTFCFVLEKLKTKGHLVLLSGHVGDPMGHTRVVYGVGEPTNEFFNAFNPLRNQGYETPRLDSLTGNIFVGWAK
jgi:hypothetical protein